MTQALMSNGGLRSPLIEKAKSIVKLGLSESHKQHKFERWHIEQIAGFPSTMMPVGFSTASLNFANTSIGGHFKKISFQTPLPEPI